MTWAQWEDLIRCSEVFQANDTPIASDDHSEQLERNMLNKQEQESWDEYLAKMVT